MKTRSRMILAPFKINLGACVAIAGLASFTLAIAGCAPTAGGKGGSMNAAMTEYEAQQYSEAHDHAAKAMSKSTGTQRERAAYIAGLSAYQAGDAAEAEAELSTASVSSDPQIAGNSKAMLGQLRLDQRRPREAATYFEEASRLLEGEDARQAAWHAGLAYRQAGDEASAKRWLNEASGAKYDAPATASAPPATSNGSSRGAAAAHPAAIASNSSTVRTSTTTNTPAKSSGSTGAAASEVRLPTVGFTLQIGAFADKNRARTAAEDAEALAKKEGLGRVRIIPRRDARGQPMYLVHVGWWVTRDEATAARGKVGRLEYIVAPAPAG